MALPAPAETPAELRPTIDDELIARWIEPDPVYRTPDRARIAGHGASVTAVVTQFRLEDGDPERVQAAYELPPEAVAAALAYYARHRQVIDAAITLNAAAFAES